MSFRTRIAALIITAASLIAVTRPACTQYVSFTGSHVQDASGVALANGTICALATDNLDAPIKINVGSTTVNAIIKPVCANIASGVIASGYKVADPATSFPAHLPYRVTITDLDAGTSTIYKQVAVTSGTFNWDAYLPPYAGSLTPFVYQVGPTGPAGPACTTGGGTCNMTVPDVLPADQATALQAATKQYVDASLESVKRFGATGNGTTDDTAALNSALASEAANGGCLYFPRGAYKTTSQLTWNSPAQLCLRGESSTSAYIYYASSSTVAAALQVKRSDAGYSNVNIRDMGFAANLHASYALQLWRTVGTLDTLDFLGGSVSSFEGEGVNFEGSARNLRVSQQWFAPFAGATCVNGITLGSDGANPSGSFSMESPQIEQCSGIGLNATAAGDIVVTGAQIAANGQNLVLAGGTATGQFTFISSLFETNAGTTANIKVASSLNRFVDCQASQIAGTNSISVSGNQNSFEGFEAGDGSITISGTGTAFRELMFAGAPTFTDTGIGTTFDTVWSSNPGVLTYNFPQQQHSVNNGATGAFGTFDPVVAGSGQWFSGSSGTTPIFTTRFTHTIGKAWQAVLTGQWVLSSLTAPNPNVPTTVTISDASPTVTIVPGYTVTFSVNSTTGQFQMSAANTSTFNGTVIFVPYSNTAAGSGPSISTSVLGLSVNGKLACLADGTNCNQTVNGPSVAPAGSCTTIGWVFSQDGHATFCNGSTWVSKL